MHWYKVGVQKNTKLDVRMQARLGTLRILYVLKVLMCLTLASLDVEAAFMNAPLNEELYIRAPPGTDQLPDGCVYRLKKTKTD